MARLEKLRAAFLNCSGPFKWLEFERLLTASGYVLQKSSGGSACTYVHETTKDIIRLHQPHDGVMGAGMVSRLRTHLIDKGVI